MADEYIRRDDFIQYLEKCKKGAAVTNLVWAAIMAIERDVRDMPAADVAPVVHGEWYLLDDCANAGLYCSVCSRRVHREEFAYKKLRSKYCPHCGAKMDGGNGRETD